MLSTTTDVNFWHSDCLRESMDIGGRTIYNICTGTTADVPWGSADWVAFFLLAAALAIVLSVASRVAFDLLFDRY